MQTAWRASERALLRRKKETVRFLFPCVLAQEEEEKTLAGKPGKREGRGKIVRGEEGRKEKRVA